MHHTLKSAHDYNSLNSGIEEIVIAFRKMGAAIQSPQEAMAGIFSVYESGITASNHHRLGNGADNTKADHAHNHDQHHDIHHLTRGIAIYAYSENQAMMYIDDDLKDSILMRRVHDAVKEEQWLVELKDGDLKRAIDRAMQTRRVYKVPPEKITIPNHNSDKNRRESKIDYQYQSKHDILEGMLGESVMQYHELLAKIGQPVCIANLLPNQAYKTIPKDHAQIMCITINETSSGIIIDARVSPKHCHGKAQWSFY